MTVCSLYLVRRGGIYKLGFSLSLFFLFNFFFCSLSLGDALGTHDLNPWMIICLICIFIYLCFAVSRTLAADLRGGGDWWGWKGQGTRCNGGELLFLARKSRWVESDALRTWRVAVSRAWRVAVDVDVDVAVGTAA